MDEYHRGHGHIFSVLSNAFEAPPEPSRPECVRVWCDSSIRYAFAIRECIWQRCMHSAHSCFSCKWIETSTRTSYIVLIAFCHLRAPCVHAHPHEYTIYKTFVLDAKLELLAILAAILLILGTVVWLIYIELQHSIHTVDHTMTLLTVALSWPYHHRLFYHFVWVDERNSIALFVFNIRHNDLSVLWRCQLRITCNFSTAWRQVLLIFIDLPEFTF